MGSIRYNVARSAWFIDYVAADGRRIRQTIGPGKQNRRLAQRILAHREAEAMLGRHHLPASRTARFGEWADDWLRRIAARVSPKTLESYEDAVNHLKPFFGETRLGAITRRGIEDYLSVKSTTGTRRGRMGHVVLLSPTTINYSLSVLKFILKDAGEHGYLTENPAVSVKPLRNAKEDSDGFHFLRPDQIEQLLKAADEPYRTLYQLAVHTGLRRGELLGLRWRDVDCLRRVLHVRRSLGRIREEDQYFVREMPVKTRHSRRTIDLSPTVVEALLAHPNGGDANSDYVFRSRAGGPIDPSDLNRAFRRHLARAGLPRIRFHDLRHTHASFLIEAGVHPKAIQARMGHASITTTLNTYGHLMPSAFQGIGEKLDILFKGRLDNGTAVETLGSSNTRREVDEGVAVAKQPVKGRDENLRKSV